MVVLLECLESQCCPLLIKEQDFSNAPLSFLCELKQENENNSEIITSKGEFNDFHQYNNNFIIIKCYPVSEPDFNSP